MTTVCFGVFEMLNRDIETEYLKNCWRLILGQSSEESLGSCSEPGLSDMESLLNFLYQREYEQSDLYQDTSREGQMPGGKSAGRGKSQPTVFQWLEKIRSTFPQKSIEIMEKHAIDKYELKEILNDKKILESLEPNKALLQTILQMKGSMKPEVLESAKKIVKSIVDRIKLSLEEKIYKRFSAFINKNRSTVYSISNELDFIKTINKNLKNYDFESEQILFEDFFFYENIHKKNKWDLILVVDESGSMMDSVLYSSIMASIFATLPVFRTKLVIFDTEVVDLTSELHNIIEVMFKIRLGGGTDIAKALAYSSTLITNPHKTVVVLVSDFYDWDMKRFYQEVASIIDGGSKFIGVGALSDDGSGVYDKNAAKKLAEMGADVAALTPEALIDWIRNIIK